MFKLSFPIFLLLPFFLTCVLPVVIVFTLRSLLIVFYLVIILTMFIFLFVLSGDFISHLFKF